MFFKASADRQPRILASGLIGVTVTRGYVTTFSRGLIVTLQFQKSSPLEKTSRKPRFSREFHHAPRLRRTETLEFALVLYEFSMFTELKFDNRPSTTVNCRGSYESSRISAIRLMRASISSTFLGSAVSQF